jgi:SAM-dependent methyltransferase
LLFPTTLAGRFPRRRLLAHLARRLRPGGVLLLLDFCRGATPAADLAAMRVYLEWFSGMSPADAEAYLTRVRTQLHLLDAAEYPARARRAGFAALRPFLASPHVGGWVLEVAPTPGQH